MFDRLKSAIAHNLLFGSLHSLMCKEAFEGSIIIIYSKSLMQREVFERKLFTKKDKLLSSLSCQV